MSSPNREQVSTQALQDAQRRLRELDDVLYEEEGDVPAWLIAARIVVHDRLQEGPHD
jgi:hypothetical protein